MAVLAKITEGQRSAIFVSLGVVGLISVVTLATMVPLYVTTRNDLNYLRLTSNMRSTAVEQELMMLIAANNQTESVEEVLVNGTFSLELLSNGITSENQGIGNYQIRKNTYFGLIELLSFHITFPTGGTFPTGPLTSVYVNAVSFNPLLESDPFDSFLHSPTDAYLPIDATGAVALGVPCAATNPPTCTITPDTGPMEEMINTIALRTGADSYVYFEITPGTDFINQPYVPTGTLNVNLKVQLKSFA